MRRLLDHPLVRDVLRRLRPLYDAVFRRRKDYSGRPGPVERLAAMQGRGVFMFCFGRSGSTVFADFLASHPDVTSFGEVLSEDAYHSYFRWLSRGTLRIWPLYPTLLQREFYRFAERLVRRARGQHGLFDLKLESLHLIEGNWRIPGSPFALYDHLRRAGAPVILLTRRDLVARFVSGEVAQRRGAFHSYQGRADADVEPFAIDLDRLREQVARIEDCHATLRTSFEGYPRFVELAYEDLFAPEGGRFADGLSARMAQLIGVEDRFDPTPRLQRMSRAGAGYDELITNWDEVEHLRAEVLARGDAPGPDRGS